MSRRYLGDVIGVELGANLASNTATVANVGALVWPSHLQGCVIPAGDFYAGRSYRLTAAGVVDYTANTDSITVAMWALTYANRAAQGSTSFTGTNLGASFSRLQPTGVSGMPWVAKFLLTVRSVATRTACNVLGIGAYICSGRGATAASSSILTFGGSPQTLDNTTDLGLAMSFSLSANSHFTPAFVMIERLN